MIELALCHCIGRYFPLVSCSWVGVGKSFHGIMVSVLWYGMMGMVFITIIIIIIITIADFHHLDQHPPPWHVGSSVIGTGDRACNCGCQARARIER